MSQGNSSSISPLLLQIMSDIADSPWVEVGEKKEDLLHSNVMTFSLPAPKQGSEAWEGTVTPPLLERLP